MALSKQERLQRVFEKSQKLFNNVQAALRNERLQCLQDRRFANVAGAQWEDLRLQFENRPMMEVNKVALAVRRGVGEYRNNRVTVNFVSKDGAASNQFADVCSSLFRADEQDSSADEAYDVAFEDALTGGFGAYRLRAVLANPYEPDETKRDYQRIIFEPIYDADNMVFFDLNAKQMDKSDATHCWVLSSISRSQYQADYGELPEILTKNEKKTKSGINQITDGNGHNVLASMQKSIFQSQFDWLTPDVVYLAEYYCVEMVKETSQKWVDPLGNVAYHDQEEFDEDPTLAQFLTSTGWINQGSVKVPCRKVHKYLMDGAHIIRDDGYIAGENIPVIPVYGIRQFIDNVERCQGIVRTAKDPQRILNVQTSRLLEIASLSTFKKPIMTPEQVAGHEERWATDNINQYPYLLLNPLLSPDGTQIVSTGPSNYTNPPEVPQALSALISLTSGMIDQLTGAPTENDKIMSNVSGKAADVMQQGKSLNLFQILDNNSKSRKRTGEVWLSMAKEIYVDSGRFMKAIGSDGQPMAVELNKPTVIDGVATKANSFDEANLDVAVDVGPTSVSRKQALVRELTGLLQYTQTDPQTSKVIQLMILRNIEGEGLGDFQEWTRQQLVQMGVLKPTDEEKKMMEAQAQKPDPQAEALKAMADQQTADATLKRVQTMKALADAKKASADADKIKAEEMQILQTMKQEDIQHLLGLLAQLKEGGELPEALEGTEAPEAPMPSPSALPNLLQNPAGGQSTNNPA